MNHDGIWKLLIGLCLVIMVPACRTIPATTTAQDTLYQSRARDIESRQNWELEGRLAVNDGKDGGSGNFRWIHQPGSTHMDFHGALGRGAWRLDATEQGATLEMANGGVTRAATISDLAQEELGWQIPLDALEWWVRGLQAPGKAQRAELDGRGLLTRLSQFGWDIEYGRYNDSDVVVMPYKMTARRQNQTVKLVVRRWFLMAAGNADE